MTHLYVKLDSKNNFYHTKIKPKPKKTISVSLINHFLQCFAVRVFLSPERGVSASPSLINQHYTGECLSFVTFVMYEIRVAPPFLFLGLSRLFLGQFISFIYGRFLLLVITDLVRFACLIWFRNDAFNDLDETWNVVVVYLNCTKKYLRYL